jgi:hypothetical protein
MGEYIPSTTPASNPTLKNHKLLIVTPLDVPASFLDSIRHQFPDLDVVHRLSEWGQTTPTPIPDDEWKDVTVLMTFGTLPTAEQAPKLQFVQLVSAGANHILDNPLFKDSNVKFCTANGVHG